MILQGEKNRGKKRKCVNGREDSTFILTLEDSYLCVYKSTHCTYIYIYIYICGRVMHWREEFIWY